MEANDLRLVDIFVHEEDKKPVLDITLYNGGKQVVLLTRAKIEVLDVGEFHDCDDSQTRSFNAVTQAYGVVLSPHLLGQEQVVKISHLLRPQESDRFQLDISQYIDNSALVYVWYRLKVTIVYNEQARDITSQPILLSIPPVKPNRYDIWERGNDACIAQNKATLDRMASLVAERSRSVEAAIQFCQANTSGLENRVPAYPNAYASQAPTSSIDEPVEIFFSYAQEDEQWVKKLDDQLAILKQRNLITDWHTGKLVLGKDVNQEVLKHLQRAHIILLLISPSFLVSQYAVISALEQENIHEAVVIPVLLRPTANWQSASFGNLQVIPRNKKPITTWSNPDLAFVQVAEEIARIVETRKKRKDMWR